MSTTEKPFPKLEVLVGGSNGVEIRAAPNQKFNCVEFTTKAEYPQTILYAPWIQFEPIEMSEWRVKLANEIARRAAMHDSLISEIKSYQDQKKKAEEYYEEREREHRKSYDFWAAEREKYGLPKDFSDLK